MASIRKHGTGWQAQVRKLGHAAVVKTFRKKTDAEAWARQTEIAIERGEYAAPKQTHTSPPLSDLLFRYLEQCTATKRGAVSETYRIKTMLKHPMARLPVSRLKASAIAAYRDERLKIVTPSSVRRELVILRHCLEVARREWGVPLSDNPVRQIQMPSESNARERRVSRNEIAALIKGLSRTRNEWVAPVVWFALATGMRRGEILGLAWDNVDLDARTAKILRTKNGHARTIPLSEDAIKVLVKLPREGDQVFPISENAFRLSWERLKRRAGLIDLRFHDLRHEAVSRFFELGLNVPEVALISGHRDVRMLFRYTHPKAHELARKMKAKQD
ncbi:site-specific recombinase XerD [Hoeflea halophila]|uniref:Site-specific recombinase XerD n=1 Tax=Hoeflea halophila TaxID=714899 RepID=A0A286HLD9_9HYPH|nr:site-specific integrase [Hoeflea halophila]SOE08615.1 site-specific recombinase XerD [Hoeflea halophila]